MRVPNTDLFKFLFSFNFASLKYFYYFIKDSFYNCFLTKEAYLFNKQVGWNYNFLILYNFLKNIIIFIWEQLTTYIPFLKVIDWLFDFLKTCLDYLKAMIEDLKKIFENIPKILKSEDLLTTTLIAGGSIALAPVIVGFIGAGIGFFTPVPGGTIVGGTLGKQFGDFITDAVTKTAEIAKTSALYVIKVLFMVFNFVFKIMLIIGKFLITFVLKMLDIFYVFLKIWFHIIKNVLFIVKIFIIFIIFINNLYCDETTEDPLINSIRKGIRK